MSTMSTDDDVAGLLALVRGFAAAAQFPVLLRLLADGRPVERERIAAATGRSAAEVDELLAGPPTPQLDDRGHLIGLGLSLVPTPHRFVVADRVLYTWCATDALMFPAIIGQPASVESVCPVTRRPIRVEVLPDRLGPSSPDEVVVSRDLPATAIADLRTAGCAHGRFFAAATAAARWQDAHPHGRVRSLAEEFAHGQDLVDAAGWRSRAR
ncbi:MAG: alkylmercury lyase MerB [Pseudonocardia sp.]|nr:alkylmercury lyase MerB [Pseudonocardia sp.]